jgi:putative flippase GtrA
MIINSNIRRLLIFLLIGGLNTVFGYSLYALFIHLNLNYRAAILISTILGVIFNFFTYKTFYSHKYLSYYLFFKFVITYSIVYVVNVSLLEFFNLTFKFNMYLSQLLCLLPCLCLNWILLKYFVYRKD